MANVFFWGGHLVKHKTFWSIWSSSCITNSFIVFLLRRRSATFFWGESNNICRNMCRANWMKHNNTPRTTIKGIVNLHFATEHDWPWYSRGVRRSFQLALSSGLYVALIRYSQRQGRKRAVTVRNEGGRKKKKKLGVWRFLVFHRSLISSKSMLRLLNVRTCCNSTAGSRRGERGERRNIANWTLPKWKAAVAVVDEAVKTYSVYSVTRL